MHSASVALRSGEKSFEAQTEGKLQKVERREAAYQGETMNDVEDPIIETGDITGTTDKDYNLIWFTQACLSNVLRLETYAADAERQGDEELVEFFRRAQNESRKGADQAKELLAIRLRV